MSSFTSSPYLVVGLGNPGPSYAGNRHNAGAMVVRELAGSTALRSHKARATVAQVRLGVGGCGVPGPPAVLATPTSYMNHSGGPVTALMRFFSVPIERLVVVHDELDIPYGQVRLKRGGGEGGHNGLRSISASLGSKDYLRVRLGIGRPPGRMDPAAFVLRDFSATERTDLPFLIADGAQAVHDLVVLGLDPAQQRWHAPG